MSDAIDSPGAHRDPIVVATVAATMTATRQPGSSDSLEVSMNSRYLSNVALIIAGAFLVVASQAFGVATFEWLMFGIGAVAVLMSATIVLPSRGAAQRGLDALIGILGAWTVVASLEFVGSTVIWLGFASGAGLVALAVIGLTLHELRTERVVHSLEVTTAAEREFAHVG
jgi:hypothetical protein